MSVMAEMSISSQTWLSSPSAGLLSALRRWYSRTLNRHGGQPAAIGVKPFLIAPKHIVETGLKLPTVKFKWGDVQGTQIPKPVRGESVEVFAENALPVIGPAEIIRNAPSPY